ncbi:MAG: hypothetical protein OHK0053_20770 [Microscillaceae bacterium]
MRQALIIYLGLPSQTGSNDLPTGYGRAALYRLHGAPAYLVFQRLGFTLPLWSPKVR